MKLLTDKYSAFDKKKEKPYGKAGEEVRLISEHDNVLIVESKAGARFSVRRDEVK